MAARLLVSIAFLLGLLGLCRWVLGVPEHLFTSSWSNTTAPSTAVLLMSLGACGWVLAGRTAADSAAARRRWGWVGLVGVATAGLGVYRLVEIGAGADLGFDSTFRRVPQLSSAHVSTGMMSFPTSLCMVLMGASTALLARRIHAPRPRVLAGWASASASAIGALFGLGYAYGSPLTYGGKQVAMSANTAIACLTLGMGLAMVVSGHERWERARGMAKLRRARESLEQRVRERTRDLRTAMEALEAETDARRRSEASLVHAQKMESIGRLAAGVAHDFNNYLMVVRANTALLEEQTGLAESVRAILRRIGEATANATALASKLLMFAKRPATGGRRATPAGPMLEELVSLVRPMLGRSIRARAEADLGVWPMMANAGELQQVMVNLCINARDAMPEGGELEITARNAAIEGALEAMPEHVPPGQYVILEVKDTGTGMSREVVERVFEPFFTTKGRGTGLGLTASYGIVRDHGGRITVESKEGEGTRFRVFVPRA